MKDLQSKSNYQQQLILLSSIKYNMDLKMISKRSHSIRLIDVQKSIVRFSDGSSLRISLLRIISLREGNSMENQAFAGRFRSLGKKLISNDC